MQDIKRRRREATYSLGTTSIFGGSAELAPSAGTHSALSPPPSPPPPPLLAPPAVEAETSAEDDDDGSGKRDVDSSRWRATVGRNTANDRWPLPLLLLRLLSAVTTVEASRLRGSVVMVGGREQSKRRPELRAGPRLRRSGAAIFGV